MTFPDDPEILAELTVAARRGIAALFDRPPAHLSELERQLWTMGQAVEVNHLAIFVQATRPWGPDDPPTSDESRAYWLFPLAMALADRWRIQAADRPRLRRYAATRNVERGDAKVVLLAEAVALTHLERGEPTTVRFGRSWVTGDEGTRTRVVPGTDLDYFAFLRWFVARSLRVARAILRSETEAPEFAKLDREALAVPTEDDEVGPNLIDRIYAAARDDLDRRILEGLKAGEAPAAIARALGIPAQTVYTRRQRLRGRIDDPPE